MGSAEWAEITRLLVFLFLFCGLGLTGALGFLLGHAILPSLIASHDAPATLAVMRWLAYPVAAIASLLTVYALARALVLAADVMQRVYPRTWI
jgi:hypothetical protein